MWDSQSRRVVLTFCKHFIKMSDPPREGCTHTEILSSCQSPPVWPAMGAGASHERLSRVGHSYHISSYISHRSDRPRLPDLPHGLLGGADNWVVQRLQARLSGREINVLRTRPSLRSSFLWKLYFSSAAFLNIYTKCFPKLNAKKLCEHIFRTFDIDQNGFIDFKEFLLAIDVTSSGSPEKKLSWAFR